LSIADDLRDVLQIAHEDRQHALLVPAATRAQTERNRQRGAEKPAVTAHGLAGKGDEALEAGKGVFGPR
jgi:hypothetical protein